jgi:RNA polymerase sigma-70 factor (ECF subfamily)
VGDLPGREAEAEPLIEPGRLQQALDELDEGFRTPLILFYFEEFSYRDIAEQMELPIGTVMSRLARAKAYLRAKLSPNGSQGFAIADADGTEATKGSPGPAGLREGSRVM